MSRRRASDGAGSVLSFTFLDVLMCTMGSLLLLLVVFGVIAKKATRARREGEDVKISLTALSAPDAPKQAAAAPAEATPPAPEGPLDTVEEINEQLARLRSEQDEVERIRQETAQRRREEEARIAHLEDHERRLEHELGQLHVTLQVLEATEQKQSVDQAQAEAEVARLKELVKETEDRLDALRKSGAHDKSYAIVPYKGKSGTFRQPVFVECTADAVTIQPEGIRLTVEDFDGPLRSGNPLAAAIRAAHEELNGRAVAAGRTDLPDPYPLLIVRPDGAAAYAAALDAIRSWDSDYGYEFVEADWKLKYAEPDPRLAQIMSHAVDEARQRQALLARVAPRQYAPRLSGGDGGAGDGVGDGSGGAGGFGELASAGAGNRIGSRGGSGSFGDGAEGAESGNALRNGGASGVSSRYGRGGGAGSTGSGAGGNFSEEFGSDPSQAWGQGAGGQLTTGNGGGMPGGGAGGSGTGPGGPGSTASGQGMAGAQGVGNSRNATAGTNGGFADDQQRLNDQYAAASGSAASPGGAGTGAAGQTGGPTQSAAGAGDVASGSSGGSASSSGGGASGGGASGGGAAGGGASGSGGASPGNVGSMGGMQQARPQSGSVADTRGANWANAEASRRSSAITRPVRVVVNADKLTVLPESGAPGDAAVVSFQQPVDRVVDQLAGAVQMQVVDWGLAGDGMYWRPTLVVTVTPGAERQAERIAELLDNSGLDIRLPQATASGPQPERQ